MATIKVQRAASVGSSLNYGELAIGANQLYFGNSSNNSIEVLSTSGDQTKTGNLTVGRTFVIEGGNNDPHTITLQRSTGHA
jgi:hypothetical protein